MKLSKLQKFILVQCRNLKKKEVPRREFLKFYLDDPSTPRFARRSGFPLTPQSGARSKKPSKDDQQNIITKSLMRLIKKDLLVGFGEITRERIYVARVRITRTGRRVVSKLLREQQKRLPLGLKKVIK